MMRTLRRWLPILPFAPFAVALAAVAILLVGALSAPPPALPPPPPASTTAALSSAELSQVGNGRTPTWEDFRRYYDLSDEQVRASLEAAQGRTIAPAEAQRLADQPMGRHGQGAVVVLDPPHR